MPFPIFYQGQILFRNGSFALDVNCCCDEPVFTHKRCVWVRLGAVGHPNDISVTPPLRGSVGGRGKIVFHGNSKDTNTTPNGTEYHIIYWIIEYCAVDLNDAFVYENELELWARFTGMAALTGLPDEVGLTSYAEVLFSCSDFHCQQVIDQMIAPPGVPFVQTFFLPLQPRVRCPDAIYVG